MIEMNYSTFTPLTSSDSSGQVICEGDSLTVGIGAPEWLSYPLQMGRLLRLTRPKFKVVNVGMNGTTTMDMLERAKSNVDSLFNSALSINIAIFNGGINDVRLLDDDPATIVGRIHHWCLDRRAVGFKVVVMTLTPSSFSEEILDVNAMRKAVNLLIRENYISYADAIADLGEDAIVGQDGEEANEIYYPDRLHMTAAGYAIKAQYAYDAVMRL
jgi:lysophospholipase L1-like esterase